MARVAETQGTDMPQAENQSPSFRRLAAPGRVVRVNVDGQDLNLPEGEVLAAALLAEGKLALSQSIHEKEARGPFCLMGTCAQCSCQVDGLRHQRTCRMVVREGMDIKLEITGLPGGEKCRGGEK